MEPPITAVSILPQLRERTRHLHDRVERVVDLPARMRTPSAYADFLVRLHAVHASLERRLASMRDLKVACPDLQTRWKTPLLEDDLRALGHRVPVAAVDVPELDTTAEALGCLYVLEGSTLGGQIICKEIEARLPSLGRTGRAFFGSYGRQIGPKWKAFLGMLNAYAEQNPAEGESIISSAEDTFRCFARCLAR